LTCKKTSAHQYVSLLAQSNPITEWNQNGTLAVENGRGIASIINNLLKLPFKQKIATRDYHPPDHCSFASQHPGAQPFTSTYSVHNLEASDKNDAETQHITLWPDHCVQGTRGCDFIPELDTSLIDHFIKKGVDRRFEAYSGFGPPFRKPAVGMTNLSDLLSQSGIKRVFVCGLAFDYCVKWTAIDAADAGYKTFVIEDASKAVDQSEKGLREAKSEMEAHGVFFVSSASLGI
jgi:nicotinamidase-related amidase